MPESKGKWKSPIDARLALQVPKKKKIIHDYLYGYLTGDDFTLSLYPS